jgi:carbonic anhydrase
LTLDKIIELMLAGNARFVSGKGRERDMIANMKATAGGPFSAAVVVSCIGSRHCRSAVRPGHRRHVQRPGGRQHGQ